MLENGGGGLPAAAVPLLFMRPPLPNTPWFNPSTYTHNAYQRTHNAYQYTTQFERQRETERGSGFSLTFTTLSHKPNVGAPLAPRLAN